MGSKINLVRFFTTTLVKHGGDHWLEHDTNHAVDAGGASGSKLRTIIEQELAAPGSSGRPSLPSLTFGGATSTFHESLDFEETATVDAMAYVFTLPPETRLPLQRGRAKLHHATNLKFQADVGVPTRFVPKAGIAFVEFGETLAGGKSAWIEINREKLTKSAVAQALRDVGAKHMVVPVGLNIVDDNVGISSWILPYSKAHTYSSTPPAGALWHGGPHPPENTSITIEL